MSELIRAREVMAKKMNVMVRKIEGITSFVLAGQDENTPGEIYFVVGADADTALSKVLTDLNFLITNFLRPSDSQKSESDGRMQVDYQFDVGLTAHVIVCGETDFPAFEWWVPYLDKNGAAAGFYPPAVRKAYDPTTDEPAPDPALSDEPEEEDASVPEEDGKPAQLPAQPSQPPVPEPTAAEPAVNPPTPAPESAPEPAPVREPAPEPTERDKWNYFYDRVNIAKHAISGGSVIYACETIGELRKLLIKMICQLNGINENYLRSIDLLPENHRAALLKTYPSKPESGPMISALAAELSIFEELMKRLSR